MSKSVGQTSPPLKGADDIELFIAGRGVTAIKLLAMVVIGASILALVQRAYGPTGWELSAAEPMLVMALVTYTCLVRNRVRAGMMVLLWGMALVPVFGGQLVRGNTAPILVALPVAAMAATWLLGLRHGLILSGIAIASSLAVYLLESAGFVVSRSSQPAQVEIGLVGVTLMGAILGGIATAAFKREYGRASALAADLQRKMLDLERSEQSFSALFRANPLASMSGDRDGRIININDTWLATFGYHRDDVIGRSGKDLNLWIDDTERDHIVAQVRANKAIIGYPVRMRLANGECRQFLLSVSTFELTEGWRYVGLLLDQTDRLAAEAAQRALNVELETRVAERTHDLSTAMAKLKVTQEELVRSETLASLGAMVAGISHELNTPIGNTVTVASTLQGSVTTMETSIAAGQLKRSALDDFLARTRQAAELLLRSTTRASELIRSFKQVAVDQTSERRREFDLHGLCVDILATLQPTLKHHVAKVSIDIPQGISCDSFPGPLGQVVSNLILNASIHAFEGRNEGSIRVTVERTADEALLHVTDDGIGMDAATLAHVFDPFFTTKLGQGSSGLGLSICHRIASSVLGGELKVTSSPGQGTCFSVRFPCIAPGRL